MKKLADFIASVLASDERIQAATQGRVYPFTTKQGTHEYPMIYWSIVTDKTIEDYLHGIGQAWKSEAQIDVFTKDVSASANLAQAVCDAFNSSVLTDGILSSYSNEVVPSYADEDETIHYAVRVFINHTI